MSQERSDMSEERSTGERSAGTDDADEAAIRREYGILGTDADDETSVEDEVDGEEEFLPVAEPTDGPAPAP